MSGVGVAGGSVAEWSGVLCGFWLVSEYKGGPGV